MTNLLRDLLAHCEWANAEFFRAWGGSPACDHEELRRREDHILLVQRMFLALLRGEAFELPPKAEVPSHADLKAAAVASHAGLCAFAAGLDEPALAHTITQPFFKDPPCVLTVPEALVQVVTHTQHHRGQCMTRLNDFGGKPRNVDWIIWLWKGRPAALWT